MCFIGLCLLSSPLAFRFRNVLSDKTTRSCPFTAKRESLALVSTCRVLCPGDVGFVVKFPCDAHVPVNTEASQSAVTGNQVLAVSVRWWVRRELSPSAFSGLVVPLMIVLTVYFSCKGCSQGWISQSTRALASLPGLNLLKLISAPHLLKGAVLKVPPRESSPCPAAPRDQHGHGF